ncbi:hypothetical protein M422DRAFT_257530 [Sphaerobolus stellatus SS14]|uniref:Uncharacterized protein n=1 Tax=Sphaerobolus stellatus (strain SS14) TaxID=990650 RepID=A0A0C9VPC7_SPHS4|nr:hypothetical protein M422DRAFT_257530 [Sphaerobolus stellatus SS14]
MATVSIGKLAGLLVCPSQPTDFNNVALYFGQQLGGDPSNEELGEQLAIVPTPVFQLIGPHHESRLIVPLTIQNPGSTNITVGTFYIGGAVKLPGTSVTKTRVQVV